MNTYEFNPEHGELKVWESPIGGRHWEIHLNDRGVAFLSHIAKPDEKIQ